jgi:gamma-glutamyltranspeptidase/glutathione hydrolase
MHFAKKGFPAGSGLCRSIASAHDSLSGPARAVFAPKGTPPSPGDWIQQESLGHVIEEVSRGGPRAFYCGWPAEKICSTLTELGVETNKRDFSDFKPEWAEPLRLDYKGTTIYEHPPNSMGATALLMLKYLEAGDLAKSGPLSAERLRTNLQAARLAYARRDEMLCDPRFGRVDMKKFMELAPSTRPENSRRLGERDTTAFSAVDRAGNIVSVAQSLFHHFGSRVFVEDCGIMMNSRGAGFRLSGPNKVEPRKRPLHTLSCLLIDRGEGPKIAMGKSGGEYRPLQHALFVTNIVDYSMSLEQSIDHPRFLWSGGKSVLVEFGYDLTEPSGFEYEGSGYPGASGACQGIEVMSHAKKAVCDVRGDGLPSGH